MGPETAVHVGVNNLTTVTISNEMIEHIQDEQKAKLRGEEGEFMVRGNISHLHADTPFRRRWQVAKNEDLWNILY